MQSNRITEINSRFKNKKKIPEISVIVPIYNVEKWLERCVRSICNQTFKDYEILLINDGSTDSSEKIIQQYAKRDLRIRAYSKKNGGLSDARNYGLKFARGKFVVFVDSDDFLDSHYLEKLYKGINKYHASVAICGCNLNEENGKVISSLFLNAKKEVISGRELLEHVFNKENGMAYTVVWNKMFSRGLFKDLKFAKGKLYEDEFINPSLYWSISKIAVIDEPMYNYVQRNESIIKSKINEKKIIDAREALTNRIKFYKNKDRELYNDSLVYYCNWLIDVFTRYSSYLKVHLEIKKKLRKDFKIYSTEVVCSTFKEKIKMKTGYYNLELLAKLKKFRIL